MKPTKDKYNLKPCPFCGGEAEINMLFGTYLVGCSICHAGIIPHYEEMPLDKVVEEWNRRPEISEEEVREQCRARNQMVISGELFHVMFKGISYRPDEMPIDGVAAYRIGEHKTLWLTVPNGTVKDDKLGGRIIVEEANTPYVATYYREDDE